MCRGNSLLLIHSCTQFAEADIAVLIHDAQIGLSRLPQIYSNFSDRSSSLYSPVKYFSHADMNSHVRTLKGRIPSKYSIFVAIFQYIKLSSTISANIRCWHARYVIYRCCCDGKPEVK